MFLEIIRYSVFGLVVVASGMAAGAWAIRTRRINPFSRAGQLIRRSSDPVLRRIETWIHRRGGNPQNAEAWLAGGVMGAGIVVVAIATALTDLVGSIAAVAGQPNRMIQLVIVLAARIVSVAVVIRAIGSWFGLHRYSPFAKPIYAISDWIVEPLRRWIPPVGGMDMTPLVAFILLQAVITLIS